MHYTRKAGAFEKLVARFGRLPKDFTYDELRKLLTGLGYTEELKGKASGSRVAFVNSRTKHIIRLHKPHPDNTLKTYQMALILSELKSQGVIQ